MCWNLRVSVLGRPLSVVKVSCRQAKVQVSPPLVCLCDNIVGNSHIISIHVIFIYIYIIIEGSLESNFQQYGQMKNRDGKSQREEKSRREKIREEKESEEKNSDARKGRKVAKHCVFSNDLWLRRVEKCTPLWREAHLQVKKLKAPHVRSTFGS